MRELGRLGTLLSQTPGASTMQGLSRLLQDGDADLWKRVLPPRKKKQYCERVWLLQPSHWLFCSAAQAHARDACRLSIWPCGGPG